MVHFGARLVKEQYPPWADKYINYRLLKEKLDDIKKVDTDGPSVVVDAKKHIFQGVFDDELKKVW
jgi:SPX domain protein involved in polyphosphate accumulation